MMKNKKLLIFFLLIFIFIPFTKADPSFVVYTPKRDQVVTFGDNVISWDPHKDNTKVAIHIYKGLDHLKAINVWVNNTGEYIWNIDNTDKYEYGCDYRIKIKGCIIEDLYGWSEYFCIDLRPIEPIEPTEPIEIDVVYIIIMVALLAILVVIYYDKKTHKIRDWVKKIQMKKRS